MNWLAIGILSLLALSMMISSKHFRVIMGTVAVVAVTVAALSFLGIRALPSAGEAQADKWPLWTWRFEITRLPNLRKTAEDTSAELWADMEGSKVAEIAGGDDSFNEPLKGQSRSVRGDDGPDSETSKPKWILVERIKVDPSKTSRNVPQEVTVHEQIANVIRQYLEKYHIPSHDPGVDQLQPEDLDWRLIKFVNIRIDRSTGIKYATPAFDDKFHNHVRERGRQLVTKDHLLKAGFASAGTLAMLTTLFGLLKLRQAKREVAPAKDLLASSGVWMV